MRNGLVICDAGPIISLATIKSWTFFMHYLIRFIFHKPFGKKYEG